MGEFDGESDVFTKLKTNNNENRTQLWHSTSAVGSKVDTIVLRSPTVVPVA